MDEPTNDLDIETLVCSRSCSPSLRDTAAGDHDRAFLDNTVTSTLVFEGGGRIGEYVGGYADWVRQRAPVVTSDFWNGRRVAAATTAPREPRKRKLSFKERG